MMMDSSTASTPKINERQQSIVERRPMFVSAEGAPLPLSCVIDEADSVASASLTQRRSPSASTGTNLPLGEFTSTLILNQNDASPNSYTSDLLQFIEPSASNWASPTSRRNKGLRNRVGERLGNSVLALNNLKHQYNRITQEASLFAATLPQRGGGSDITVMLKSMHQSDIVMHCAQLHQFIQEALGMSVEHFSSDELGATGVSAPADGDVLSSTFFRHANPLSPPFAATPHVEAADGTSEDHLAGDLTHSMSTMSMVAEPVRTTREARKSIDDDGSKMINEYVMLDDIGRGSFGKVKLAFDTNQCRMVAIKILRKPSSWGYSTDSSDVAARSDAVEANHAQDDSVIDGSEQTQRRPISRKQTQHLALQREIAVMKKLRHKNIVSLFEVIDDPDAEKLYIVMQYVDNGSVGKIVPDGSCTIVPPGMLLQIAAQLLAGLQYLHSRGVVHRDIKPENILINTEGDAFLADFGVSEYLEQTTNSPTDDPTPQVLVAESSVNVQGKHGTKLFMAPELLRLFDTTSTTGGDSELEDHRSGTVKGRSVDTWALGVTLCALLTGRLPFHTEEQIMDHSYVPAGVAGAPAVWVPLLSGLLERKWEKRWTAQQARQYIKLVLGAARSVEEVTDDVIKASSTMAVQFVDAFVSAPVEREQSTGGVGELASANVTLSSEKSNSVFGVSLRKPAAGVRTGGGLTVVDADVWNAFTPVARRPPPPRASPPPAATLMAARLSPPESSINAGGLKKRGSLQGVPFDELPSKAGVKLRNAVVIDLEALDANPNAIKARAFGNAVLRGNRGSGWPAMNTTDIPRPSSMDEWGETRSISAPPARRENTKCSRRLQELLDEQTVLETQRRLVHKGFLS